MANEKFEARKVEHFIHLGEDVVNDADHIPLGSLAQAIGRARKCVITLRPFQPRDASEPTEKNKATCMPLPHSAYQEYVIHFLRSADAVTDPEIRYSVGHELAHVLLGHPIRWGLGTPEEEAEAHFMAGLFLLLHGAPTREDHGLEELVPILEKTQLSSAGKWKVLSALQEAVRQKATSGHAPSAGPTDVGSHYEPPEWAHAIEDAEVAVQRFENEPALAESVWREMQGDFSKATAH